MRLTVAGVVEERTHSLGAGPASGERSISHFHMGKPQKNREGRHRRRAPDLHQRESDDRANRIDVRDNATKLQSVQQCCVYAFQLRFAKDQDVVHRACPPPATPAA